MALEKESEKKAKNCKWTYNQGKELQQAKRDESHSSFFSQSIEGKSLEAWHVVLNPQAFPIDLWT